MRKFFGTDGVRDVANSGKMTSEIALKLGRAFIKFADKNGRNGKKFLIGRDTRLSCQMLEGALFSGMSSEGAEVYLTGVIPTPGLSYAIKELQADGGAVISASHNPAEYNGIKFLGSDGCKLSDESEESIENLLNEPPSTSKEIGRIYDAKYLVNSYTSHIAKILKPESAIKNIVFDCANGASAETVPELVKICGLDSEIISRDYDGLNINKSCGVMHMQNLTNYVTSNKKFMGFAFDGDADRVLICDSQGRIIDGDIILWVLARWLKCESVVVTVMSNLALENHLAQENIKTYRCPVGDRYVLEKMRETGSKLGGEQSGHIIASDFTSTGDGLCTAMLFLNAIKDLGENVNTLIDRFGRYPQKLTNLTLTRPRTEIDMEAINLIVKTHQEKFESGRIFVRTSGTEPLLRILVEAPEKNLVEEVSQILESEMIKYA